MSKMKVLFDLAIIDQLGEKLYTQLPPILAEYISNSYDADSNICNIVVDLIEDKDPSKPESSYVYNISIVDDGCGIADNSDDIEKIFLSFGRKKRIKEGAKSSPKFSRPYHGKKGIGKLAGFGCAEVIEVETICNKVKNRFFLNYQAIQDIIETNSNDYFPEHDIVDQAIEEATGTKIVLYGVKRNTKIDLNDLALRLSARLQIFNDNEDDADYFKCSLIESDNTIVLSDSMYYDYFLQDIEKQYSWTLDEIKGALGEDELNFFATNSITFEINTSKTPLKRDSGITVYCRKKLAAEKEFFQERQNDNFHSYLYGKLIADFIDEDDNKDFISTERVKINWDKINPIFNNSMNKIMRFIQKDWRDKRKDELQIEIDKFRDTPASNFKNLTDAEKELCNRFMGNLTENSNLTSEQITEYSAYVEDMFEFSSFQAITKDILDNNLDTLDSLEYIRIWDFIEAKEFAKISTGRIQALEVFEQMIDNKESERDKIQPFLEQWPWLLDSSITNFNREITYEKALKVAFPNDDLDDTETNRRLDFYCIQDNIGEYVIIELKRPGIIITKEILDQANEYRHFIKGLLIKEGKSDQTNVKTILIVEPKLVDGRQPQLYATDNKTQSTKETVVDARHVIVKTYSHLIDVAKKNNNDIIDTYNKFNNEEKES